MSFKCNNCGETQPNGVKPNKVIVENRNVTYTSREGKISTGTEIVKEVDLCIMCKE